MSDQTINYLHPDLKELNSAALNMRLRKLRRIVDRLDFLAHDQKRLVQCYKELILQCTRLVENMDHVDVMALEIRQELEYMLEICERFE